MTKLKDQTMTKITIFKLGAFILLFAFVGAGCEKENEDEYEDVLLENIKCPCEHEVVFGKTIYIENILLFDAKNTSWDEMKTQTFDGEKSEFVAYSEDSKSMIFYSIRTTMTGIGYVCNIPDKINDWTIPSTGAVISFKADAFDACSSLPSISQTSYEIILTSLKRKIK
jgi:hypothetical protein